MSLQKNCLICNVLFVKDTKIAVRNWEKRKYCSRACVYEGKKALIGPLSPQWKENPGYGAIHDWMRSRYGRASYCQNAECPKTGKNFEWANLSGDYFRDRRDWLSLCNSCHKYMDRKNLCDRGHELTPENTYINPGHQRRECRMCRQAAFDRAKVRRLEKLWR